MSSIDPYLNPNFSKKNLNTLDIPDLFQQIKVGNTAALSQGITLLESELPAHKANIRKFNTNWYNWDTWCRKKHFY
jgi:hypothetical protein